MNPAPTAMKQAGRYDLFFDLTGGVPDSFDLVAHLKRLTQQPGLADGARRATVALGPDARTPGASNPLCGVQFAQLGASLAGAASRGVALAIVRGPWRPGVEVIAALSALQDLDPMIGALQPRFAALSDDRVIALPGVRAALPRAALSFLPEYTLTPELPAGLIVLTAEAVKAVAPPTYAPLDTDLAATLVALRRRGFRNLVANRVVAPFSLDASLAYPNLGHDVEPPAAAARARAASAAMPERALEALLAGAFTADGRPRVLLDCRGMTTLHNGTSQVVLGYLEGFAGLAAPDFEFNVLATTAAARFHGLKRRYPQFRLQLDAADGAYLAAVLLNQPWSVEAIAELHARSLFILFNMLDTISWDIIYPGPTGLDETWRLLARVADGLLFISDFTRRRFVFRFSPDPAIPLEVAHLAVAAEDIVRGPPKRAAYDEPYLLLFGNDYDHKSVGPTLATLTEAFPFTRIVALGLSKAASHNVTALPSGALSEAEIDALVAHAAAIVYPSHYEGFGLPVTHGLARNRTVIVRRSALWDEIAGLSQLPGRLAAFSDDAELVRAVGQALHGRTLAAMPTGGRLSPGESPPSWRRAAETVVALVRQLASGGDGRRWMNRELMLGRMQNAAGRG